MNTPTLITGLQWGDEGKGKCIDYLSPRFDITVRFNGGNNAGHTVVYKDTTLHLSLLPSGVLHGKKVLISQGVLINPEVLISEINHLKSLGKPPDLGIDPRCHVIMPYHQLLDSASEAAKGKAKTGSLHLGIGFCSEDRTNRAGIRLIDLLDSTNFKHKLDAVWELKKLRITKTYDQPFALIKNQILTQYLQYGQILKPYLLPVPEYLLEQKIFPKLLLETAQGFYLDFVFGTYPYTVAYHTLASSALADIGLPPTRLNVIGVVKSYTTRVGNGPHPTELTNNTGVYLQTHGAEFGTVSHRARRCGWLDLNLIRHAAQLSGVNSLILTKLDVLSGLKTLKIAVKYRYQGKIINRPPLDQTLLKHATPIYQQLTGWQADIGNCRQFSDLPSTCRMYVRFIEKSLQLPIKYLSVGPDRRQMFKI